MPALLLRFAIVLENPSMPPYNSESGERRHGPLFHGWLPDGDKDALDLSVDEPEAELRVWFEQHGFMDNGRILFDYDRSELSAEQITQAPVLDAGPLIGLLKLPNVPEATLQAIQANRAGDPTYVAFGRRVAVLLHRPVSRVLNVLRTNYGQYWLNLPREWNPREHTLGYYFNLLVQTKWSLDDGETWSDFLPEPAEVHPREVPDTEAFGTLLTPQDWGELQKALNEGYDPRLSAELLARAHELSEREDLRGAIIQATIALEAALHDFMLRKTRLNKSLSEHLQTFSSLPLHTRLAAVASLSGALSAQQVESMVKLAEMYPKIVRDGWMPPVNARGELRTAIQSISALLPGPSFKLPSYYIDVPVEKLSAEEESTTAPAT